MSTITKLRDKFGSKKLIDRFLTMIEKGGNALPHPASLFGIMALLSIAVSGITSLFDLSVIHPGTGETIRPNNLFSVPGLHYILTSMVKNVDVATYSITEAYVNGTFQGGFEVFDLAADGVSYSTSGGFVDDIVGELDALKEQVVAGEIEVPDAP